MAGLSRSVYESGCKTGGMVAKAYNLVSKSGGVLCLTADGDRVIHTYRPLGEEDRVDMGGES